VKNDRARNRRFVTITPLHHPHWGGLHGFYKQRKKPARALGFGRATWAERVKYRRIGDSKVSSIGLGCRASAR
jgi:hypothetical protein